MNKPRRSGDLERFIGSQLKAAPDVDFVDIKFLSLKFSWGFRAIEDPTTKFFWGSGPLPPHGIGTYATCLIYWPSVVDHSPFVF